MSGVYRNAAGRLATPCPLCGEEVTCHRNGDGYRLEDLGGHSDAQVAFRLDLEVQQELVRDLDEGLRLGKVPAYPADAFPFSFEYAKLPAALVYGAALAAAACAVGGRAQLRVIPTWMARAILWVPLLAARGAGKSPAQDLTFAPLRDFDQDLDDDGIPFARGRLHDGGAGAHARPAAGARGRR